MGYACKERERVGLLTLICSFLPIKKRGDRENDWFLRHFFFIPTIASMCLSQHHDNDSLPSVILRQSLHFSLKIPFTGRIGTPHEYLSPANCEQHHQSSQPFTGAPLAVHLEAKVCFWVDVVVYIHKMIFTHSLGLILWRVDLWMLIIFMMKVRS
ncbi:hypothetical protein Hanom_Chr05g00399241 [Helianthus anomalus]